MTERTTPFRKMIDSVVADHTGTLAEQRIRAARGMSWGDLAEASREAFASWRFVEDAIFDRLVGLGAAPAGLRWRSLSIHTGTPWCIDTLGGGARLVRATRHVPDGVPRVEGLGAAWKVEAVDPDEPEDRRVQTLDGVTVIRTEHGGLRVLDNAHRVDGVPGVAVAVAAA